MTAREQMAAAAHYAALLDVEYEAARAVCLVPAGGSFAAEALARLRAALLVADDALRETWAARDSACEAQAAERAARRSA